MAAGRRRWRTRDAAAHLERRLLKHFPEGKGWELEVLGTDISTRVLEKARTAMYPIEKSKEIPAEHLRAYMLKGKGDHKGEM